MTGKDKTEKLRKENESLRNELHTAKEELKRLAEEMNLNRSQDGAPPSPAEEVHRVHK